MTDCQAKVLVTADGAWRGEKPLHLKALCDVAMEKAEKLGHRVQKCVVVAHLKRVTPGTSEEINGVEVISLLSPSVIRNTIVAFLILDLKLLKYRLCCNI